MSKVAAPIKGAWAQHHLDAALALMPAGSGLTLDFGGRPIAAAGDLRPEVPGMREIPLHREGKPIGTLRLRLPDETPPSVRQAWEELLAPGLQVLLDARHARDAVAKETLETYRDLALLQHAIEAFTRSLKPEAVTAVLIDELGGRADEKNDCGAVFLYDEDRTALTPTGVFGHGAQDLARALAQGGFLEALLEQGDIASNLTESSRWDGLPPEVRSLLWMPMTVHGEHHGLLVLASRRPERYDSGDMKRARTLAPVAASALRNAQHYAAQQALFQSFVRAISNLIDAKSPYTNGHCRRVRELSLMLAEEAHRANAGPLAGFTLDDDERTAIEVAAMLHDCGKVVTPEWVIDKPTKLTAIVDRMELIAQRFELLRRNETADVGRQRQLDEDLAFLRKCNLGSEFMSAEHVRRVHEIAGRTWRDAQDREAPLLTEDEVNNLCVQRGTLNPAERKIVEDHALHTINMLSQIAFPRTLRGVTEYAGSHHERMDGRGYPRGLKGEQLPVPARILAIADVFEALTAPDRPYRQGGTLSWAVGILKRMKDDGHLDCDLLDIFLSRGVHLAYADRHLTEHQRDLAHPQGGKQP